MVATSAMVVCSVCRLPTRYPVYGPQGESFCCPACQEVDRLIRDTPIPTPNIAATTEQETLMLSGMWCTSCAWLITESLRRMPGVQQAEASFVQRQAQVTFDPQQTSAKTLLRRVKRLGYRAWLTGETPRNEESELFNRLIISGVFVLHDMVVGLMIYGRELLGWATPESEWLVTIFNVMMLIGVIPVLVLLGWPVIRAGLASLVRRQPNMHTLIALGACSAVVLSIRNLVLGTGGVYFDTASMLLFLVAIGRWLELQAQEASRTALDELLQHVPNKVTWISPEGEQTVTLEQLPKGARVRIGPGQRFPVDGIVLQGQGDVDESLLTGEPTPLLRSSGDPVLAGTLSLDGTFEIGTTAIGSETQAGKIGSLLHEALWRRAPLERLADRWAAIMVPVAVVIALATFGFWMQRAGVEAGLLNALSVLLIACPCALGIATPLTFWIALGRAAKAGILLRSTAVLEQLAHVRTIFFDKTGTLSQLPLRVQTIFAPEVDPVGLLRTVAAVETGSAHPLAEALIEAAKTTGDQLPEALEQHIWPGLGVSATIDTTPYWVGNRHLMLAHQLTMVPAIQGTATAWQEDGATVVFVGWDGEVRGAIAIGETMRPEVPAMIDALQAQGLELAILTGDDHATGRRWQTDVGIPVYAEQRPEEKLAHIRASAGPTVMIGDGINDGPALAQAHVGIAMGQGIDVAQAAADTILLHNDLRRIPWLIELARKAKIRVHQNLIWAFFYNVLGVGLAVSGMLQPVFAALAMLISSLLVILNAMRLSREVRLD